MWLIDCSDRAYNKSQNEFREFFVLEQDGQIESKEILHLSNRRLRALREQRKRFFVCEKWRTPNSNGETQIFDYYEFATYTEACVFIADLIVKLNSPIQNALIKAAQSMVDKIIPIVPPKAKALATKLRAKTQQIYECDLDEITFNDNYSRVYVMLFDNAAVKIGVSQNVKKRMKQFEGGGMLKVLKLACTQTGLHTSKAYQIEKICHEHFADRRKANETFNISFDEGKKYLQTFARTVEWERPTM